MRQILHSSQMTANKYLKYSFSQGFNAFIICSAKYNVHGTKYFYYVDLSCPIN